MARQEPSTKRRDYPCAAARHAEKPSPHSLLNEQDADRIRRVGTIAQQETDQAREAARKQIKQSRDAIARADALLARR
jgi:hypothetical protein